MAQLKVSNSASHSASHRTLKDIHVGETVRVLKVGGEGAVRRRLMDMGLTKGVDVLVRKLAPLGDPIEVNLRGYALTLRKEDAMNILVEGR